MANIQNWLTKIMSAVYGREMRQALHDSIKAVNDELDSTVSHVSKVETNLSTEISERKNADSILQQNIIDEADVRGTTDSTLQQAITKEVGDRQRACGEIQQNLSTEISERKNADSILQQNIIDETNTRKTVDEDLRNDVTALQEISHTHDNRAVLDEITEERLTSWDSMGSNGTYIMELIGGIMTDIALLQKALGIVVYDGGLFEQEYNGETLDGGSFSDNALEPFDCGSFETAVSVGPASSIDGGQY